MTDRERLLCRIAIAYVQGQMGDLMAAFCDEEGRFDFNGEIVDPPTSDEFEEVMFTLQG